MRKLDASDVISVADTMRYFEERLPNLKCPACGEGNFNVDVQEDYLFAEWNAKHPDANMSKTDSFWPVIVVSCTSCGCILPFAYSFVMNWVAANPKEKAPE